MCNWKENRTRTRGWIENEIVYRQCKVYLQLNTLNAMVEAYNYSWKIQGVDKN
jgi:hypothetical protein